jgi:hypothetical protein
MSLAAQCLMCRHAIRRGRLPVGCLHDPDDTQAVLNDILYRLAATSRCGSMERFNAGPDAYIAHDDETDRLGDAIMRAAARLPRSSP